MSESKIDKQNTALMERTATRRAGDRAKVARWDLDVAVLLFAVLILIVILLFSGINTTIVAPIGVFGLSVAWLVGWIKGRKLYKRFYAEELLGLRRELKKVVKEAEAETVDEKIQKALKERLKDN
jgi:Flp pilus assembly protein TadB